VPQIKGQNFFTFGSTSSSGVLVLESKNNMRRPEKEVERIHVPGRDGDILIDHGAYQNAVVEYVGYFKSRAAFEAFWTALRLLSGYQLLSDSYVINEQRLALLMTPLEPEELLSERLWRVTIQFSCKPQRYYNYNLSVSRTATGLTVNSAASPTKIWSRPYVEIYGAGTVEMYFEHGVPQPNNAVHTAYTQTLDGLALFSEDDGSGGTTYTQPSAIIDSEAKIAYRNNADGTKTLLNISFPYICGVMNYMRCRPMGTGSSMAKYVVYGRWFLI